MSSQDTLFNTTAHLVEDDDDMRRILVFTDKFLLYTGSFLCLLGLPCNLLSLAVFTTTASRNSSVEYLRAISFSDMVRLTVDATFFILVWMRTYGAAALAGDIYKELFIALHYATHTSIGISVFITVLTAVDRYVQICHVHLEKRFCQRRRAKVVICTAILAACSINVPQILHHERVLNGSRNFRVSALWRNEGFLWAFRSFTWSVFYVIPLCILLFCNVSIVRRYKMTQRARRLPSRKLTVALLGLVACFFVAFTPHVLLEFISDLGVCPRCLWLLIAIRLADLFLDLSAVLNFGIYGLMNPNFVTACKGFLRRDMTSRSQIAIFRNKELQGRLSMPSKSVWPTASKRIALSHSSHKYTL